MTQTGKVEFKLDRERYFKIAREKGLPAAITALHQEMWKIEHESFEGKTGWRPDLFEYLKEYRAFSVELWNGRYKSESETNPDFKS